MKRIAVVDDEPDITIVLKRGLEHHGFAVDTFNDPQAVLASFKPGSYDLMIIDIRMPKINGFDLYRELKKRDGNVKVCFLTAFEIYYEEFRKMFPTIDIRAFIRKPVSISNLVSQVNSTIESE
ncbi:putative signal transduction response regulator [Candidatus Nitrososphaera gargensis Ga9.2]|uniref:Putative signal transduction response regulator n=1 Tax=Nitrososphaera gargensis (strain Ga9.2) TaxID=1237085 RepID=K0ICC7_NITGG|nr:response regulator [Candidatus Nitrososphaera gargensis]AFU57200.1 putative signal transduction response regulator [Candidatus Nitrososphaera gargensis Ga9.2]